MLRASLFIITSVLLFSCAPTTKIVRQDYPSPFQFELVDTATGTKDQLYIKAWEWMAKSFKSSKDVIQMQDKEAGKLIGRFVVSGASSIGWVYSIIAIDTKDGKYKITISDFEHEPEKTVTQYGVVPGKSYGDLQKDKFIYRGPNGAQFEDKTYYAIKNDVMSKSRGLLSSLQAAMHKNGSDF
ncbi:MAG: DUF4468 domain-containing protein [Bacteroidetes bacterium]|nr:DUF4468 domain-containing protein [Bacteroidota bacterium]